MQDINVDGTLYGIESGILICVPAPPTADRVALEQRLAERYGITI